MYIHYFPLTRITSLCATSLILFYGSCPVDQLLTENSFQIVALQANGITQSNSSLGFQRELVLSMADEPTALIVRS